MTMACKIGYLRHAIVAGTMSGEAGSRFAL